MDKLAPEILELLRDLLAAHQRLLSLAQARQEAMRAFDIGTLNRLQEREEQETRQLAVLEKRRREIMERCRTVLGRNVPLTMTQIAQRLGEPRATQVLTLAAQLKKAVEQLERVQRINAKASQAVVSSIAKVLKIVTGMAQHAGLYMRNGRKASLHGIHLLDAVG